ncbi:hypothetical protein Q8A67_017016 [Cirrhinus molitorella]|uniref:Uncharacterized protein n=1 Tax=Cirrhinus molitorella TaxID=172907 RepID=A0AA88PH11_9TELE|nr:hypothetical protein Q8A67_017016 [Cirrhinus molitorella]
MISQERDSKGSVLFGLTDELQRIAAILDPGKSTSSFNRLDTDNDLKSFEEYIRDDEKKWICQPSWTHTTKCSGGGTGKGEKLGSLGRTEEGSRKEKVIIRICQTRMLTIQAQDGEEEEEHV